MTRVTTAAYLYGVVQAVTRPSMTRAPGGLSGATPPESHRIAPSLWIVAAAVPLDVYGPNALEPRLRDLDWVAQAAVAHEAVVEHLSRARGATVIPMKLFTMFSSLERAIADVAARKPAIVRTMRRIAGAEEWGVRVFRRPVPRGATRPATASGAEFLRARKQARDAVSGARATAAVAAEHAFDRLRRLARDAHVRGSRSEPGTNPPILDAAFLVASASRARFQAEARTQAQALAAAGADLALTGPWPAYNFVAPGEPA
jgi:Gas vesicle synthesis protein GvpL/GvpF